MKSLLSIYLVFIWFTAYSQSGTIKGIITGNGKPLEFVAVALAKTPYYTSTNAQGFYEFKDIPFGLYELRISFIGYQPYHKQLVLATPELAMSAALKETPESLNEVVITGTLKEVAKMESPVPVEIYTPKFFQKNPTPSLFEALGTINGVRPQLNCNVCNTGDIHINGMEGPYTMVMIDGMPIVSSLSTVYGLSGIPNSIVQRIEIVKGPASTLYGSEAVGGLINVITKNPAHEPLLRVDVNASSYEELSTDLSLKARMGKATAIFSGNYFHFNNRIDVNNDNFTDVTLQKRISVFNKWNFERKDNRVATVAFRYLYEDRFGGEMQWNRRFRGSDSIYGESIYTKRVEIIGNYQLPLPSEKVTLNYSINNHDQDSYYGIVKYLANQKIAFTQLLWDKKLSDNQDGLFGIATRYTFYDDNSPATEQVISGIRNNMPQHTLLPGIFAQDELLLNQKSKLLLGMRYDYNSIHGSIFTPRINFKYTHDPKNTFRLSMGNGYRVVNLFTEDHAALTGSRVVIIKNALKPERSYNANLNYVLQLSPDYGFMNFDATLFYTYFTNKIIADYNSNADQIIYDNLRGYAISKGVTLNTDLSFTCGIKVIAGFTVMDVYSVEKRSDGASYKLKQVQSPPFSGTWSVSYTLPKLNVLIDYTGNVTGPMLLPVLVNDFRPDKSPWFSLMNVQCSKKFNADFEIYLGVKNLLNFIPQNPLMRPFDPFDKHIKTDNPNGYTFDTTYNYAPLQKIRTFLGLRYRIS